MKKEMKEWIDTLGAYWHEKYGYSIEYCDAEACSKRNYYPTSKEEVPFH